MATSKPPTSSVAASSSLASVFSPSITASFTATNPQCTQNHVTMLVADAYYLWMNEPHPLSNVTLDDCYAPAAVSAIIAAESSANVLPFQPMIGGCANAGAGYQPVLSGASGYVACCPTSYSLHVHTGAPSSRPALGATCYSNMPTGTATVTVWNTNGATYTQAYANPSGTAQAYAHVLEGYPPVTAVANTTPVPTSSLTSSESVATSTTSPLPITSSHSSSLSGGAVAGIVVGAIAALALALTLLLLCLRTRRRRARAATAASNPSLLANCYNNSDMSYIQIPYDQTSPGYRLGSYPQSSGYSTPGDAYRAYMGTESEIAEAGYNEAEEKAGLVVGLGELPSAVPSELPSQPTELQGSRSVHEMAADVRRCSAPVIEIVLGREISDVDWFER